MEQKPNYAGAMRGYIALSRVAAADNMLVARSFNPLLFRLGSQPFPSLLFRALNGEFDDMPDEAFMLLCADTEKASKKKNLLKDIRWKSSCCGKQLPWSSYFIDVKHKAWDAQYEE